MLPRNLPAIALLILTAPPLLAQALTGSIMGVVMKQETDPNQLAGLSLKILNKPLRNQNVPAAIQTFRSGPILPNATVVLSNDETGFVRSLVSQDGYYFFSDIPAGVYDLKMIAGGCKTFWQSEVAIQSNAITHADEILESGHPSELTIWSPSSAEGQLLWQQQTAILDALNSWASSLAVVKNYNESSLRYREALEIDPENAQLHEQIALNLAALANWNAAEQEFATALRLDPQSDDSKDTLPLIHACQNGSATTGCLIGVVVDESDARVAGANVTLTNAQTGTVINTQAGDLGIFSFIAPPATYDLSVSSRGFMTLTKLNIKLLPGVIAPLSNIVLAIGRIGQTQEPLSPSAEAAQLRSLEQRLQSENRSNALVFWGDLLAQAGRHAQALCRYREALELQPNNAHLHGQIGLELAATAHLDQALLEWETSLRLDPQSQPAKQATQVLLAMRNTNNAMTH